MAVLSQSQRVLGLVIIDLVVDKEVGGDAFFWTVRRPSLLTRERSLAKAPTQPLAS